MAAQTQEDGVKKIRELIKNIKIGMMSSIDGEGHIHSRPMFTQQTEADSDLWFFTSAESPKAGELEQHPQVNVSFSKDSDWVSISGAASIVRDRAKIDELWHDDLKAFFPNGKDDPNIALLKVEAEQGEYWDSPSSAIVRLFGFAKSKMTGKPYMEEMMDHKKVEL